MQTVSPRDRANNALFCLMSETTTVLVYLLLLIGLLLVAGFFVFRQVWLSRQTDSTMSRLQNKLNKGNGTAQEYYELGSLMLDKQLYAQGIRQLQKAIRMAQDELKKLKDEEQRADQEANIALIYNALGYAYFVQEQYDLAIRQYKDALKLTPGYAVALNNLANTYEKKQLTSQALETYEQVLQYEPDNAIAKRRVGALKKRIAPSS